MCEQGTVTGVSPVHSSVPLSGVVAPYILTKHSYRVQITETSKSREQISVGNSFVAMQVRGGNPQAGGAPKPLHTPTHSRSSQTCPTGREVPCVTRNRGASQHPKITLSVTLRCDKTAGPGLWRSPCAEGEQRAPSKRRSRGEDRAGSEAQPQWPLPAGEDPAQETRLGVSPPWCSAGLVTLCQELWSQCAVTADQQQTPQDQSRVRFSPDGCTSALEVLPRTGVSISPNLPGENGALPMQGTVSGAQGGGPLPHAPRGLRSSQTWEAPPAWMLATVRTPHHRRGNHAATHSTLWARTQCCDLPATRLVRLQLSA